MISLAHIVNPVVVSAQSDLSFAQPITFVTMERAKAYAAGAVEVSLFSAQYPEDRPIVPGAFTATRDLDRSVLDCGRFEKSRKLPLIADILARLSEGSSAEYFLYTNVDIAVLPQFYALIGKLIAEGHDAVVINRRVISDRWRSVDDLDRMFSEVGQPHPGYDCFLFRRDILPRCDFGQACIGANWIGRVILSNLIVHAARLAIFTDLHVTFHIGEAGAWLVNNFNEFDEFNRRELTLLLDRHKQRPEVSGDEARLSQLRSIRDDLDRWYAPKGSPKVPLPRRIARKLARILERV